MKKFSLAAIFALVVGLASLGPTTVKADITNLVAGQSINLATVITNNLSVEIGDKIFGDFSFTYNDFGAPDTDLVASNINVKALDNVTGFGLEFQEPLIALNTKTKVVTFQYTAMVDPEYDNLISDLHLAITGAYGGAGTGTVNENAYDDSFGGTLVGNVQASLPGSTTGDADINPQQVKLWVHKDVTVSGNNGGPTSYATITILDQTFSQIPEPSTALLVGLGVLSVVALKRRS
ncbi:MAG TPA: PEP-CTERM sorting domain-containing protein [Verrucomicrobiae bacterium]|nr:PEP-CTERM sorting domain-containing protein [Verrucomicrobiae bacterium]